MTFYEEISKYYDYIFPISSDALKFIKKISGTSPKSILDVACGTGEYSIKLAKDNYNLTAIDLDIKMIESLNKKIEQTNLNIKTLQCDMLNLKDKFDKNQFDAIFCIGNSLVHLDNIEEIEQFFTNVKYILKENGKLIIQIINFDRILLKNITSLPTIYNNEIGLIFERYYRYEKSLDKIFFKTILTVGKEKIENEIPLKPLMYDKIITLLNKANFYNINIYGDFNNSAFNKEDSYALILEA